MYTTFELVKAESWNNGKGGEPYMWIVYLNGDKTKLYCGANIDEVLNFIKERTGDVPF